MLSFGSKHNEDYFIISEPINGNILAMVNRTQYLTLENMVSHEVTTTIIIIVITIIIMIVMINNNNNNNNDNYNLLYHSVEHSIGLHELYNNN